MAGKHAIRRVHQTVKAVQCIRCPDVYLMVGNVPISLAKPVPITIHEGRPTIGICPRHPRKGVSQDS